MDFIAIDFETANPNYASVCAAGWATVRKGEVVEHGSWMCQPPPSFGQFAPINVGIHGITAARVANQPTFEQRVPDLLQLLNQGLPIIAHNANFDFGVLKQSLAACGREYLVAERHCTREWSKRLLQLPNNKLPTVCAYLGVSIENHHDAGSDALSAARVALRLAERAGVSTTKELDAAAISAWTRISL